LWSSKDLRSAASSLNAPLPEKKTVTACSGRWSNGKWQPYDHNCHTGSQISTRCSLLDAAQDRLLRLVAHPIARPIAVLGEPLTHEFGPGFDVLVFVDLNVCYREQSARDRHFVDFTLNIGLFEAVIQLMQACEKRF